MIFRILLLLLLFQGCKTPSEPVFFSGNTYAKDKESYQRLMDYMKVEWSNMCLMDSSGRNVEGGDICVYLFLDSIMHIKDFHRESRSKSFISRLNSLYSTYTRRNIYTKIQKQHEVQLLSIQDIAEQPYRDTVVQEICVVIDGDTCRYPAYLVKRPIIEAAPRVEEDTTTRWDFKIPFSIDIFWDLYKDEPLVCEKLTMEFSHLPEPMYKKGAYYFDWLVRMINYQNSNYARRKLCYYVNEPFSRVKLSDYIWMDSSIIESIDTLSEQGWFDAGRREDCLQTLSKSYTKYQEQNK